MELLVVVSIIAVLAGLLLPALAGVRRRGRKTEEASAARQIGIAWNLYANSSNDYVLPGFLPENIQQGDQDNRAWNVRYNFDRSTPIPTNVTETWPLRLGQYVNFNHDVYLGYRADLNYPTAVAMPGIAPDGSTILDEPVYDVGNFYPQYAPSETGEPTIPRDQNVALFPAFGYNAYYVGGWYHYVSVPGGLAPKPKYADARALTGSSLDGGRISVVARTSSAIRFTNKMILFSGATSVTPGVYEEMEDDRQGCHYVIPRWMELGANDSWDSEADLRIWYAGMETSGGFVFSDAVITVAGSGPDDNFAAIPFGRHTGQVTAVHGDLHIGAHKPGVLEDQQYWVNGAVQSHHATHRRP